MSALDSTTIQRPAKPYPQFPEAIALFPTSCATRLTKRAQNSNSRNGNCSSSWYGVFWAVLLGVSMI
jgi:hypothetical protein